MFANHIILPEGSCLPPPGSAFFEYITAANGVFVRAERPNLQALVPVAPARTPIRGLAPLEPYIDLVRQVPAFQLARIFNLSIKALPQEALFYLRPLKRFPYWELWAPEQRQLRAGVQPVDDLAGTDALIELHSHGELPPFFSATDNRDERTGFRLYAVVGGLSTNPAILVRVGVYGHFWKIPASWVFRLPIAAGLQDALETEEDCGS